MKLNNFDWEEDEEWRDFPPPEEQYSKPPLVEMVPEPPPEPPLAGAPVVPDDEEMFKAHRTDAETRALRALEQGGLNAVAGLTRTPLRQALTQPTSKAEELRQARMQLRNDAIAAAAADRNKGIETPEQRAAREQKERDDKAALARELATEETRRAERLAELAGERQAASDASKANQAQLGRDQKKELEAMKPKPAPKGAGGGRGAAPKGAAKGADGKGPKMTAMQYAQWVQAKGFIPIIKDLGQKFKDLKLYDKSAIAEAKAMKDSPSMYKLMGGNRVAKYNAISGPFLTMLGDMMQVGVITDSDMRRYAAMIPEPGDSVDIADTKVRELSNLLQAKVDAYRTAFNIDAFFSGGGAKGAPAGAAAPKGGEAEAVKAKLREWLAKNPKHPRRAEAEERLRKLER